VSTPETLEQAVAEVASWLTEAQLADIRSNEWKVVSSRLLGTAIRNRLGLWNDDCPLRAELPPPADMRGPWPDYASGKIIEALTGKRMPRWRRSRGTDGLLRFTPEGGD
jgi:Domain of unknown function (DUF6794)